MKSMVLIIAISSVSRYTAASSDVSMPTRRFESEGGLRLESASDRTAGPILAAHPQVRARPVRVFFLNSATDFFSQALCEGVSALLILYILSNVTSRKNYSADPVDDILDMIIV